MKLSIYQQYSILHRNLKMGYININRFACICLLLQIAVILCKNESTEILPSLSSIDNGDDDTLDYRQQVSNGAQFSSIICILTAALGLSCFMASFATNKPLANLHIVLVMQLCFLSTSSITSKNPITNSFASARFITGYNQKAAWAASLQNQNSIHHDNILSLGYETSFFSNFNIMFIIQNIMFIFQLIAFLLFHYKRVLGKQFQVFQRITMLFVIFNAPNMMFSISLMQYDRPLEIILALIAAIQFLLQIVHLLFQHTKYLGIKQAFKDVPYNFGLYLAAVIVFKSVPCVIFGCLKHAHILVCIIVLVFQLLSCIFLTITRAYDDNYINIVTLCGQYLFMGFLFMNLGFAIIRQSQQINPQAQQALSWIQVIIFIAISILAAISMVLGFYYDQINMKEQHLQSDTNHQNNAVQIRLALPDLMKSESINLKQLDNLKNDLAQQSQDFHDNISNNRSAKSIFKNHQKTITFIQNFSCNEDDGDKNGIKSISDQIEKGQLQISNTEFKRSIPIIGKKAKKQKVIKFKNQAQGHEIQFTNNWAYH